MGDDEKIGPFYQFLGALLALGAVVIAVLHAKADHGLTGYDIALIAILVSAALALLRPKWFDNFAKEMADKIPFLAYRKPENRENNGGGLEQG